MYSRFLLFISLISLVHLSFTDPINHEWRAKIDPLLHHSSSRQIDLQEALVIVRSDGQMKDPGQNWTKDQKAEYVYQSLIEIANKDQKEILIWLNENGVEHQPLFVSNVIWVNARFEHFEILAQRKDVEYISANLKSKMEDRVDHGIGTRSVDSIEWGIKKIQADKVWDLGYSGQGVVVGGQDTGVEWEHSTLIRKYRGYHHEPDSINHNFNWHDAIYEISPLHEDTLITESTNPCGLQVDTPCDDYGHGTYTMGTMVGSDSTNNIGVAPDARWIACRNMERGYGTPFSYLQCFQWFLAPTDLKNENADPLRAPHVINNSWSCPIMEGCSPATFQVMNNAVKNLTRAGIVVVVSAGNGGWSGCGTVNTPSAIFEDSFTVGATNQQDGIAGFSSRGPVVVDSSFRIKPDVVAPGTQIRSASRNQGFSVSDGTSAAGPHVAATVALMISANPTIAGQVEEIKQILIDTAIPLQDDSSCGEVEGSEIPNNTYGYGRIDALAAVNAALDLVSSSEDLSLGLNEIIEFFPNPFNDHLNINVKEGLSLSQLNIFNAKGQLVFSKNINEADIQGSLQINFTNEQNGVYFYEATGKGWIKTGKLIKHR